MAWRQATKADLDTVVSIQESVHTLEPETREVFAAKLAAFPQGCRVLDSASGLVGYGIFHPWRLDRVPALHALPFVMPDPADCLFVHDVALLPPARGQGAARALLDSVKQTARERAIHNLSLVSVYDSAPIWERLGFRVSPMALDPAKRAQYGDTACFMTIALAP